MKKLFTFLSRANNNSVGLTFNHLRVSSIYSMLTLVAIMLMMPQGTKAGEWSEGNTKVTFNFSAYPNKTSFTDGATVTTSSGESLTIISDQTYNQLEDYFAVQGTMEATTTAKWWIYNGGLCNGIAGVRTLSILKLYQGDNVTITYNNGKNDAVATFKDPTQMVNAPENNTVVSGTTYTMAKSGTLDLNFPREGVVTKIEIKYNSTQILWSGTQSGTTANGMPIYRYRLSKRWFDEPTPTPIPNNGQYVTNYIIGNYADIPQPEGKTVAIKDPNVQDPNIDILFINEGYTQVTARFNNNTYASYLVEAWDNEAYSEITEIPNGNKFQFKFDPEITNIDDQGGVVKHRVVTGVEGVEMWFGIPRVDTNGNLNIDAHHQPNTTVVYRYHTNNDNQDHMVSFTNGDNGWWDRVPNNNYQEPTSGTFYVFRATAKGKLKVGGVKDVRNNNHGGVIWVRFTDNGEYKGRGEIFPDNYQSGYVGMENMNGIDMEPGDVYYIHGDGDAENNRWSPFLLEWFSYEIEGGGMKLSKPYGVSDLTGYEINQNGSTITDTETNVHLGPAETLTILGYKGTITGADVEIVKTTQEPAADGHFKFSNITFSETEDGKMGGAIKVRLGNRDNASFYRDYVFTIPYGKHVWDFRNTTTDEFHDNGGDEEAFTAAGLAADVKGNTTDLSRVYKVHSKPSGVFESLIDPLLVARGKVNANNAFYLSNTSGLMVFANGESFGTQEKANENGILDENGNMYEDYHGLANIDDNEEYTYPYTTVTAADMMWLDGQRNASNMSSTEIMDSKILFPGVKPNQYIKIYMHRHADNKGEIFTAENLMDLAGKKITSNFTMHGSQFYRDTRGAIIFRVPEDYVPTQDVSKIPALIMKDDGWAYFMRIEITDDYTTEQRSHMYSLKIDNDVIFDAGVNISEQEGQEVFHPGRELVPTSGNNSVVYENSAVVRLDGTATKTFQQNAWSPQYTVENVGNSNVVFTTERVARKPRNAYYCDLVINITGGTGNLRIIQEMKTGDYILDRCESYLAVNQYHTQSYPYTWDFTAHNMSDPWATGGRKSAEADATTPYARINGTSANNAAEDYGRWESGKLMNYCGEDYVTQYDIDHYQDPAKPNDNVVSASVTDAPLYNSYDASAETHPLAEVIRPVFANGGELTYGVTPLNETKGLRFSLPLPGVDEDAEADDIRTGGTYAAYNGTLELATEGLKLTTCSATTAESNRTTPTITINKVKDMYVFVNATNEPIANAGGESLEKDETYPAPTGVYVYKIEGNDAKDVNISFNANTTVYKIGVTDIEKSINELGYATESRNHAIDHTYTGEFTSNDVNAYAITTYMGTGDAYNYKGYAEVRKSTNEVTVVPANTGVVLYKDGNKAQFSAPLFYPAVNVTTSATDEATLATNFMAPNVEPTLYSEETESKDNVEYTRFIMTRKYYTYNKTTGTSSEQKTSNVEAFYRQRIDKDTSHDEATRKKNNTIGANKSYLLIPTKKLPLALWNNGNGQGTAEQAKNTFFIDLAEWDEEEVINGGIATELNAIDSASEETRVYYTLEGIKLNGKPTAKGVYLCNGKKVFIK